MVFHQNGIVLFYTEKPTMLNSDLINGAVEAARFIGITPRTVYHMCEAGTLPHIKKGKRLYFRRSELEAAFRSQGAA